MIQGLRGLAKYLDGRPVSLASVFWKYTTADFRRVYPRNS